MMRDFPDEIWSIIAQASLPPLPKPGARVNWNDHLNQGAILPLQRVNKVSP
jgi:hypothetical protein